MQSLQPAAVPPTVPVAPSAPIAPTLPADMAAPRTAAEVAGLRARQTELSEQLRATQQRRASVVRDLRRADPAARPALEQRLAGLDGRIAQLESDVASTERLITATPPALAATVQPRREFLILGPNGSSANAVPVLLLIVIVLQVLVLARACGRRFAPAPTDPVLRDAAARLVRLEQAVDAVAIEVERVSEGQRFVARALGEQTTPVARLAADGEYGGPDR